MSWKQVFSDLQQLMRFMKAHRKLYFVGIFGDSLINASLTILMSFVIRFLLNYAGSQDITEFYRTVYLVSGTVLALSIFSPLCSYLYLRSIKITLGDIRLRVFEHLIRMSYPLLEKRHSGDLLSRMTNDVQAIEQAYTVHLKTIVSQVFVFIFSIVVLFVLDWRFALVLTTLGLLSVVLNMRFSGPMRTISDQLQQQMGILTERLGDLISGLQVIKLFGLKDAVGKITTEAIENTSKTGMKQGHQTGLLEAGNFLIQFLSLGGILVIGLLLVTQNQMSLGILGQIVHLQSSISHMFLQVGASVALMQTSFAGAARIQEILKEPIEEEVSPEPITKCEENSSNYSQHPALELSNISFGYHVERPVLQELSFTVEEGQVTALVGTSGSGKSTIMKLLLGLYQADEGYVLIRGKSAGHYSLQEIRDLMAYVPQEATLFHGTIAENIRFGSHHASQQEVEEASKAASAHSFIMELPQGYETIVGENGANLSGGQRQRIAIARALLKNAPILLLDEATSALDAESEFEVKQAIQTLMKGRTTLIIAHGLTTVEQADSICVIADGQLQEQGTHEQLLAKRGLYAELYRLQFQAYQSA